MNPDHLVDRPRFSMPTIKATFVYLHLDSDGAALYVGLTADPSLRTYDHARNSRWFDQIAEIVWYPTPEPHAVEAEIIRALQPPYNVRHTSRDRTRSRGHGDRLLAATGEQVPA